MDEKQAVDWSSDWRLQWLQKLQAIPETHPNETRTLWFRVREGEEGGGRYSQTAIQDVANMFIDYHLTIEEKESLLKYLGFEFSEGFPWKLYKDGELYAEDYDSEGRGGTWEVMVANAFEKIFCPVMDEVDTNEWE